ncbi:methyl-accepting chemotaxis protein [Noviherbaspirillum galbum]|uniref:HAMP domain-containing protein n=1 Tax=Noviherbaspirillum galbum TaxID=2709383 RepID=A0A6B3SR66_9BURK|nr:methyl-accepting chemotaxis protein [Noviherbaspirillum galbum]NEX63141.1 HAMP domain-containing protein [Noviherbaspirillum galbum]
MRFTNVRIGVRLSAAFAVLFCFMMIMATDGWWNLSRNKNDVDVIVHERNVKLKLANDMRQSLNIDARALRNYLLYSDKDMRSLQLSRIQTAHKAFDDAVVKTVPLLRSEATRNAIAAIQAQQKLVRPMVTQVLNLIDQEKDDEARTYLRETLQQPQDKWFEELENYIGILEQQNEEAIQEIGHEYQIAIGILFLSLAIALGLGVWLAWGITQSIVRPIKKAVRIAETVASGDLTTNIAVKGKDEAGQLLAALKRMNDSLAVIVADVRTGAETIASASNQIAAGNIDLSERTEQQASALEETASTMDELTSTVKQNADNASQANAQAKTASDVATRGGTVVAQVVTTMDAINTSAKKIADIITVIDSIAFQTNILALNAAVEAARAGEQGRGFAVVAAEVRTLAQRSASAAQEIKSLIDDSVSKVASGNELVSQAGLTMTEIVESVHRVTDIMAEITSATKEQSSGIEQVNKAITDMDAGTHQNSALVEESASAAQSLRDQAEQLAQMVRRFRVNLPGSSVMAA